jgi:hypothetical protein
MYILWWNTNYIYLDYDNLNYCINKIKRVLEYLEPQDLLPLPPTAVSLSVSYAHFSTNSCTESCLISEPLFIDGNGHHHRRRRLTLETCFGRDGFNQRHRILICRLLPHPWSPEAPEAEVRFYFCRKPHGREIHLPLENVNASTESALMYVHTYVTR